MSNTTEKEIINNVIKSVEFILVQIAFDKNVRYSDSDNKQDSFDSESSDTRGEGLKI